MGRLGDARTTRLTWRTPSSAHAHARSPAQSMETPGEWRLPSGSLASASASLPLYMSLRHSLHSLTGVRDSQSTRAHSGPRN